VHGIFKGIGATHILGGSSLAENDSYTFFSRHGGLFVTGPTGTNVMDIQIIIIR